MSNIYSPKELRTMYTRIKLKHNPSGYSFRDRLIETTNIAANLDELMWNVSYDAECMLLNKICKFWEDPPEYKSYGTQLKIDEATLNTTFNAMLNKDSDLLFPNEHSAICLYNDHLNVNTFQLLQNTALTESDFKKYNILELIATVCYLCTTSQSICSDLKYLKTEMCTKFSYENLHTLQFLKDALEAENIEELYVEHKATPFATINCPAPIVEGHTHPVKDLFSDKAVLEVAKLEDAYDESVYTELLEHMYYETIAFGLEIVYLIHKYTSTEENRKIYSVLTGSMSTTTNAITKLIYESDTDSFVPAVELSEDAASRFVEIYNYINSTPVMDAVSTVCSEVINKIAYTPLPSLLCAVISFAKNLSCREIRIKQCAILYNYCKANGLIKREEVLPSSDDTAEDSFLKSFIGEDCDDKEDSSKSKKDMIKLTEEASRTKRKATSPSTHHSDSVSMALDGLVDNFKADKYTFTIKDVSSDDDSDKATYEAIASKIKLVNAQLIKQIRDIKTYNVGGKYAGLTSGKLDRKALHRYKTDKNIFYQNTYKQKECDLAFGIVLDASGSMWGRGISDGKTTMIVLHETLKALGINHSIIDHTCYDGRYSSDLRRYQCFKEDKGYKVCKNYALASITAESGNCDSGALYFMERALLRTRNRDKICLIFSDGAPTECSGEDLVEQVRHMERNGIKVIGIGIGFPNISKYYTEYANGNNLKQMLDICAGILKEYVLAKKD